MATLKRGEKFPDVPRLEQRENGRSVEKAAKAAGVSKGYVSDAKAIKEKSPETFEKVLAGEMTIPAAKKQALSFHPRPKSKPLRADLCAKDCVILPG